MRPTPGARGHSPREPGEPGEALVRRPVLGDVCLSERHHLELDPVGVLEQLHVHPPPVHQRVVARGQGQPAGDEADVGPGGQLLSAGPAEHGRVGAAPLLARARELAAQEPQQLHSERVDKDGPRACHC